MEASISGVKIRGKRWKPPGMPVLSDHEPGQSAGSGFGVDGRELRAERDSRPVGVLGPDPALEEDEWPCVTVRAKLGRAGDAASVGRDVPPDKLDDDAVPPPSDDPSPAPLPDR